MSIKRKNFMRSALLGTAATLLAGSMGVGSQAFAQDQDAADDEDAELVVVTGSRIARSSLTAPQPLAIIGNQAIQVSGLDNLAEIFNELPIAGVPGLSSTNSAFTVNSSGLNIINLRNLGSSRTLVLIDGRRAVSGQPGIAAVDLNTIPVDFIERVEIVTGGASALYGSDAIAGVVNIIFKDDFEGVRFRAQGSMTTEGGGDEFSLSATVGGNFDNGRGNAVINVTYAMDYGLKSNKRNNQILSGVDLFSDDQNFSPSSFPEAGRFFISNDITTGCVNGFPTATDCTGWYGISDSGQILEFFDAPCTNDARDFENLNTGSNRCTLGFNRSDFRTISTPTERILVAAKGHYDISDSLTFFVDTQFADVGTFAGIEPFPFASSNIFPATFRGVPIDNPFVPADLKAKIDAATNALLTNVISGTFEVDASGNVVLDGSMNLIPDPSGNTVNDPSGNPFPFLDGSGNTVLDTSDDGDVQTSIGFARRTTELRQRSSANERQTLRVSVGMRGDFGDTWQWDTSFTYGQTQQSRFGTGQINVANFRQALSILTDGSGNPVLDSAGDFQCADADARAFGCVPVNIFGKGSINDAAAAWLNADVNFRAVIEQQVFAANLTGELFDLPAGAVSIATGIEHRREASDSIPDALGQKGLNASNAIPRTQGQFNVSEWYFEGDIPLLNDSGLGDFAAIGGAVRIADYSTVGTVISWNVRGEWQPIPDIRFRVNYGQSVRAPNIAELFTAPSQTFPPGLSDPCAGVTEDSTGVIATNCLAVPGIAAQIAAAGSFAVGFQQIQGISGFNRGNPDLNEEKADTLTVSAILTPQFVPGLSITVDYYDIDIEDAIQGIPRQSIIDGCYTIAAPDNADFCSFITRWPAGTPTPFPGQGQIRFVDSAQLNVGTFQSTGIDVAVDYNIPVDSIFPGADGTLNFNLVYSYLIKLQQQTILPGATIVDNFDGLVYASKHRANLQITYDNGPLTVNYSMRFIGAADIFENCCGDDPFDYLDPETYHDVQVRYRFGNAEVYAGIQNIFGNFAKLIPPAYGSVTGCNSFCDFYDVFGRTLQAGVVLTY